MAKAINSSQKGVPGGKRARRSSAEVAAEKAARAAQPKLSREEILAKARAAAAANREAKGIQPKPKKASTGPKRVRRTKDQIAADKARIAAEKAARPPVDRVAQMAKARAARMAKLAAEGPKVKAPKEPKPPIDRVAQMAKARAARMAKLAAEGRTPKPKKESTGPKRIRRTKEQIEADKARLAAEKAARPPIDRVAQMAKARAVRMAKLAAQGHVPKPKKESTGPKVPIDRVAQMAKARAARMAKLAANPKPKKEKKEGSGKRGMSPEHMAKIRALRGKKKDD